MTEQLDPRGALAAILESKRAKQAEIAAIDEAIAEVVPTTPQKPVPNVDPILVTEEPMRSGVRSSEMWLAALLPLIVGAVVQLGWLSEQAATELGMVGGGSYVLGRSLVKSVMEWRKR